MQVKKQQLELDMKQQTHSTTLAWQIPWTAAHQAPPSMGFARQEYWSGVPLPFLLHPNFVSEIQSGTGAQRPGFWHHLYVWALGAFSGPTEW